jgi:signal transduction histidine kinase
LLELVEKEDRRLAHLVDELLDLGRIRAGALRLEYEDVDLADVVRQAVARFALQLASSGSELSVATAGDVVGCWDKTRLDQVVGNLLSNAIKFGRGRPIAITAAGHGSQVRLVVEDHGIGIEPEARARIFEPFERGVSIRHYGGLGLGLYIVKSIVTALGGSVAVDGEPGVGSTFTVELPRSRVGEG